MTDTRPAKIPKNSFIMNYQSSRMYPQLESLARKYSADKKDMANSQNVILTNGEIYFPPDAVEAIGVEKLEFMNNKSKGGAHDAINNEMAMNILKSIKPMYGGGMVNPSMKPMGTGGMVDAYAGGGMVMNRYGDGGMVKNKMMAYGDGGMVKNKMMSYRHGGMVKDKMMMMQGGGQLKPVPKDNPGLGKLPEMVRNRMGYMQDGGMVDNSLMGMMGGGMAMKKKRMMSYQDGGMIGPFPDPQMFADEQNRQLEQSIDQRMANPNVYRGSVLGAVRDTTMMLQDSIDQDTENKALKTLELMRLKGMLSDSESVEMQAPPMPNTTMADSMRMRDLLEFVKMQSMMRGMPAVRQGMGSESMEMPR
tara:strand:+ start:2915 stop:4000 length:1086 start_codon:yes stop_codon:yes gene_type:complete